MAAQSIDAPPYLERAAARRAVIYAVLCEAAERGEPCPSNTELARAAGFARNDSPSKILTSLEASGEIAIERRGNPRRVTICETGARTATPLTWLVPPFRPKRPVREIVDAVAAATGVDQRAILGRCRRPKFLRPRQLVHALAAREGWGPTIIGRAMRMDHSTVRHSCKVVPIYARHEARTARLLAELTAALPPLPIRVGLE